MKLKVDVFEFVDSDCNNGLITFAIQDSIYQKRHTGTLIGTAELYIQQPKKKKLVYQWLYEQQNGKMDITGAQFGINDRDEVRGYVRNMRFKEGGKLFPLMESEKEIDV